MGQFRATLPDIVLPVNGSAGDSNVLDLSKAGEDIVAIMFASPTGLDANTYTIMISMDGGTSYQTLQMVKSDTGTLMDYPFPASGKAMVIGRSQLCGVTNLKIHSSGAIVTTAKTIKCAKIWEGI